MKKSLLTLVIMLGILPPAHSDSQKTLLISTKDQLGFSRNGVSYNLSMKIDEFHRRFGAAPKVEKDEDDQGYLARTITDYYVNDGLMVTAKPDGRIIGFIFYLVPSTLLKAADAATDRGIAAGTTEKDLIAKYGAAFKTQAYKDDKNDERILYYKYGDLVLSFRFNHGQLRTIGINADYLPYLEK